jgi:hypothetical protein
MIPRKSKNQRLIPAPPEQIENTSDNASNVCQAVHTETKSLEDKEINDSLDNQD